MANLRYISCHPKTEKVQHSWRSTIFVASVVKRAHDQSYPKSYRQELEMSSAFHHVTSSHEVCEEVGFDMAQLHIHWSGRGPGNISVNVHLVLFEIWA